MTQYTKLGIVGAGSMGSMMTQLFAEAGLRVSIFDVKESNVDTALGLAEKNSKTRGKVEGYREYASFVQSLPLPGHRLLVFSITHGHPADYVLDQLRPHLVKGDIILDGGNEWYENTERRMHQLKRERGIDYIGMGVSGGYQSARHGPSLSPGGNSTALERVIPLLERISARDPGGDPCVAPIGPGGSGHYVKMIHNGIEQGMMGVVAEAWGLLRFNLGITLDEIGEIFQRWNAQGELRNTFLIDIAADICTKRDSSSGATGPSDDDDHVLSTVVDKVVQDADDTEGTGAWSVSEASRLHISAPSIAASHFFRLASADRAARLKIGETHNLPRPPVTPRTTLDVKDKAAVLEDIRRAVYAVFLASYTQGLQILARQSEKQGWGVSLATCLRIWRAGCSISSVGLSDALSDVAKDFDTGSGAANGHAVGTQHSHPKDASATIPAHPRLAKQFAETLPSLRRTVVWALERDAHVPTLIASLEWVEYVGASVLPTMFMEAQLDWFGAHRYGRWDSEAGEVRKGQEHFEWKPA